MSKLSSQELENLEDPFAEEGDFLCVFAPATVKKEEDVIKRRLEGFTAETLTEEEGEYLLKIARNSNQLFSRDLQMQAIVFALNALFARDHEKSKQLSAIAELVFQNTKMRAEIEYADSQKETPLGLSSLFKRLMGSRN
eukprot:305614_1